MRTINCNLWRAVLLCSALSLSAVARADEKPTGEKTTNAGAARVVEEQRELMQAMVEKLDLTADQKNKITMLQADQIPQLLAQNEKCKEVLKEIYGVTIVARGRAPSNEELKDFEKYGGFIITDNGIRSSGRGDPLNPKARSLENADPSAKQRWETVLAEKKAYDEKFALEMKEILTPGQFEKFPKIREELTAKTRERLKQKKTEINKQK